MAFSRQPNWAAPICIKRNIQSQGTTESSEVAVTSDKARNIKTNRSDVLSLSIKPSIGFCSKDNTLPWEEISLMTPKP